MYLMQYYPILIFLAISIALPMSIIGVSYFFIKRSPSSEKNSPYECGFNPFSLDLGRFNIRFYLIAILFVIFDIEIAFLFPWVAGLIPLGFTGFFSVVLFLLILTVGFIYEWRKGALEWD